MRRHPHAISASPIVEGARGAGGEWGRGRGGRRKSESILEFTGISVHIFKYIYIYI